MSENKAPSDRELEAFRRFLEILPHGRDPALVILKGHLLVEEQLRYLIGERTKNPSALQRARLTYGQCVCVARAFFPADHDPVLWECLERLNSLRNALAHQIEPKGIEERMQEISTRIHPNGPFNDDPKIEFEFSLWSMFVMVSHLVGRPSAQVLRLLPGSSE